MNEVSNCKKLICQQNEIEPPEFYVKSNYSLVVATQIKPELLQFVSFSHLGTLVALLRAIAVRAILSGIERFAMKAIGNYSFVFVWEYILNW